ncbi:hypothetical protein KPSB59_2820003 [Klebsiella quasipneumoniae subsp. quasipneumoniae]|nr:hypothetical protein KPSB59_2820003 [Klebsiella quasipneumoniae subsp. quasipneumoniae]
MTASIFNIVAFATPLPAHKHLIPCYVSIAEIVGGSAQDYHRKQQETPEDETIFWRRAG